MYPRCKNKMTVEYFFKIFSSVFSNYFQLFNILFENIKYETFLINKISAGYNENNPQNI